jgi:hypothetical protein
VKFIGLTKVRNEAEIIRDTLDHWGKICTGGIYVYDDVSKDQTVAICQSHPAVRGLIRGKTRDADRERAEWSCWQRVLELGQQNADPDDWFVYFDADERFFLQHQLLFHEPGVAAIACKLFDVYITPEDVDKSYPERMWVEPEYRVIVFFFKNSQYLKYSIPDQREVSLEPGAKIALAGVIKHFGKAISVQQWEETCDYYIRNFPRYSEKWLARKGKAIKYDYRSDTGHPLVKFQDILSGAELGNPSPEKTFGRTALQPRPRNEGWI